MELKETAPTSLLSWRRHCYGGIVRSGHVETVFPSSVVVPLGNVGGLPIARRDGDSRPSPSLAQG